MAHAKLSPSKRERWANCPGSIREEAKYPEDRSGAAAIDGTHTHSLLNKCLMEQKDPSEYITQTLKDDDGEFKVDAARVERVKFALDYITQRQLDMGFPDWYSEIKVDPARIFKRDDLSGTVDVLLIGKDMIEIIDYKDGMNLVEAEDNLQLDQYGFGVIAKIADADLKVSQKTMRFTIIQPKLRERGLSGVVSYEKPMAEFFMGESRLARQAAATDNPIAPLLPGDKQCKYCKHKGACMALSGSMMEKSGINFANLDVAQQAADKEPTTMSDEQIKEILESAPLIRQMLEGVEAEALRRFNAGKPIDGLKAVRGRGSRAWSLEEVEIAEKLKKMGVPKDVIWKTSLISVAQIEKAKWTKKDGSEDQLSPRQLKTLQTEFVKKSDGKLTIVPESDEREAVVTTAEHLFDAVAPVETLPSWLS